MAAINYSGSQSITGCTITTWSDATYYSFRLTQDCKISINGTPAINARSGDEFIIQVGLPYIFDRDTKVLLSYPIAEEVVNTNIWYKESLAFITENTTSRREYDTTVYRVTEARSGTATITIGASIWSQNTGILDTDWYVSIRTTTGETRLINNHDFDLPANSGWNYMLYSQASISITVAVDDLIAMSFIGDQYVQVGSSTSEEHGQFMRIEWD